MGSRARYLVGSGIGRLQNTVLSSPLFPLTRYVPYGRHAFYDMQRFAGTRHFDVIFDVGANIGQTAWGLTRYFPTAKIYCFEPAAEPFEKLKAIYGRKVQCVRKALGAATQVRDLMAYEDSERNTLLADVPNLADRAMTRQKVEVDTVDNFCAANRIEAIDLLKMDVQGWEPAVIAGAERMLARTRFIYAEAGFNSDFADMTPFCTLHGLLSAKGFRFCGLYEAYRTGDKSCVYFANALYINPAFVKR